MPSSQPEGAIRTVAAGSNADAIFSADGTKLYAVSGNTVTVINTATGATITSYTVGIQLGAMDISMDGHYLVIVEEQPEGGAAILYRIDLTNGSIGTFVLPETAALHDVAFLANGSLAISQEVSAPLRVVDLETGDYFEPSPAMRANATVSVSIDGTYVIAQPPGIDWPLHAYDSVTGTGYAVYFDPYAGAGIGTGSNIGAVSPDGSLVVQGAPFRVYQGDFSSSFPLSIGVSNPAALAFSPDGTKLYVLDWSLDEVVVVSTSSWTVLATYPIEADAFHFSQWSPGFIVPGEMMRVSDDGDFLSIITPTGIQLINLNLVIEPNFEGGPGDDTIVGSSGEDDISGAGGNDVLSGAAANDTLSGDEGNDWLSGGTGMDTLTGGAGNDSFYFGAPLEFSNADHITDLSAGDTIQLETVVFAALDEGALDPAAFHIGEAAATADHRIIYNSATGQILYDRDGTGEAPHRLIATVDVGTAVSAATFLAVTTGTVTVESNVSYTLADNELNLVLTGNAAIDGTGNGLDNEITGNSAANQLMGMDGADTLIGNGGNDYLDGGGGADQLIGGLGDDIYILGYPGFFLDAIDSITELAGEGNDTIMSAYNVFQLPTEVENITLTGFAQSASGNDRDNVLTGNAAINTMSGGGGNDQLYGNAGNDSLVGDSGNDLIDGGDGIDSAGYTTAESGVTVSLAITGPQDTGGAGIDTLVSIEILGGSDHTDYLTASASGNSLFGWYGNDFLFGAAGDDELDGGGGNDVYIVAKASDHWTAEIADRGFDEGAIDEVRFTATVASTLTMFAGDSGIERIVIGTGIGAAAVTTGLLAHNIDASALNYGVAIVGNDGANSLAGGSGGDELIGNGGSDKLYGNGGNDGIDGGAGDDYLYGADGSDTLTGGLGLDRMYGGTGDDIFYVADATDYSYENVGEGTDEVIASIDHQLRANIENLTLAGSAVTGKGNELANIIAGNELGNKLFGLGGDDTLIGFGGNDSLDGGAGDDSLVGDTGDDHLYGGDGNDELEGSTGYDRMYGGAGDDSYFVIDTTDFTFELAGQGHDRVVALVDHQLRDHVEDLELGGSAIVGKGNDLANAITGNELGNRLYGYGGNDTIDGGAGDDIVDGREGNDTLIGGAGYDKLYGGTGDDVFIVTDATDFAYENVGEGTDKVVASVTHALRDNIEQLELSGSADIRGYGNGLNNLILGNSGANLLYGRDGNDTLRGNGGNDLLYGENGNDRLEGGAGQDRFYGGAGADKFIFNDGHFSGPTPDRIMDFSQAEGDLIDLFAVDANSALAGDQAFSFIGTSAFSHSAGELRSFQAGGVTYVQGDTNGDGTADFLIRIDGLHTLQASDFII